jgi:hypothetical protein
MAVVTPASSVGRLARTVSASAPSFAALALKSSKFSQMAGAAALPVYAAGRELVGESLGVGADGRDGCLDNVGVEGLLALGDSGERTHGATDLLHHAFTLFDFAGSVDRSGAKTAEKHGRRDGFQFHTLSP